MGAPVSSMFGNNADEEMEEEEEEKNSQDNHMSGNGR